MPDDPRRGSKGDYIAMLDALARQAETVSDCRFMGGAVAQSLTQCAVAVWSDWFVVWTTGYMD